MPYQQDRDEERARLARWFGDSDFGPLYFAARGRAVPISVDERDLWLARAWRIADRHLTQQRWIGFEALAIALVLGSFTSLAANMAGNLVPFLRLVSPAYVGLIGLAWPIIHDQFYRRQLRALRQEIDGRTRERLPLDPILIGYGRRYNLLAGAMLVAVLASVAWTGIAALHGGQGAGQLPVVALLVAVLALHMTGRRIDDNQRRRLSKR